MKTEQFNQTRDKYPLAGLNLICRQFYCTLSNNMADDNNNKIVCGSTWYLFPLQFRTNNNAEYDSRTTDNVS